MKIDRRNPLHWLYLALFACNVLAAMVLRPFRRHARRRVVVLYGHKLNGNLLALYRHLRDHGEGGTEVVFLTLDPAYRRALLAERVACRLALSPACVPLLATAAAVISDHGLHALGLMVGRSDLKFIDVWHGIPFKGFDAGDFGVQRRFDEVWVPSPLVEQLYVGRYGFDPARVRVTGYARTDRLVLPSDDTAGIRQRIGLRAEGPGKVVLFAPTWKQDARDRSLYPFGADETSFLSALRETCVRAGATLLVRTHLNSSAPSAPRLDHVVHVPAAAHPDTEGILLVSDVLICDWSSIAFDFLLLDRPALFLDVPPPFAKGLSLDPSYRYGAVVGDLAALVSRLERCLADPGSYRREYAQRHADVRARVYGAWADGHSAERCARRLQQVL